MAEFFHMDGYAFFVWGSYAAFALFLIHEGLAPTLQRRRLVRELKARWARQRARSETP